MKGEACQCHKNSAYLWKANKNYRAGIFGIATGYALSADGMWRQHSWCVLRKPRSYQIVETTTPRELYFGVCMLYEDAEWFCNNILKVFIKRSCFVRLLFAYNKIPLSFIISIHNYHEILISHGAKEISHEKRK